MKPVWLFGYGSLIWRPDFEFIECEPAEVMGWTRRFWQGSHDHRGTPDAPGRVVTMLPSAGERCAGMAYLIDSDVVTETFEQLDHREKNGYERFDVLMALRDNRSVKGRVYIAPEGNFAWLGDATTDAIARQIAVSVGPSGKNADYLFELANAIRELGYSDEHIFELETRVRQLVDA